MPAAVATPIIRVPDEFESSIQKATDIGALGIVVPTVDTVEKAMRGELRRYPPQGRRSMGAGQAASIWGVNGVNYRETINDNMLVSCRSKRRSASPTPMTSRWYPAWTSCSGRTGT